MGYNWQQLRMKRFYKKILIVTIIGLFSTTCLISCGSFSSMSDEDAYTIGRGIGTATRVLIDN